LSVYIHFSTCNDALLENLEVNPHLVLAKIHVHHILFIIENNPHSRICSLSY